MTISEDPQSWKGDLRKRLHAQRNALALEDRERYSEAIIGSILALEAYRRARTVMGYMTFGSELMTGAFADDALRAGKILVLPLMRRAENRLGLYRARDLSADLAPGPWGIRQPRPDTCEPANLSDVDFVLVPGLGFNARGDRLGYGRGYYDRLLAGRRPDTALVAGAFHLQMVDRIPVEEHDVRLDRVVTERTMFVRDGR
ncbi:MAG: 5-formyltetrahydrofolate cyclo-ligase [Casimicrobiaceae bacterium]